MLSKRRPVGGRVVAVTGEEPGRCQRQVSSAARLPFEICLESCAPTATTYPLNQSSENYQGPQAKARFLTELFGTAEAMPSRINESRPLTANKIAEEFFHARLFAGVILLGNCSGLLAQF